MIQIDQTILSLISILSCCLSTLLSNHGLHFFSLFKSDCPKWPKRQISFSQMWLIVQLYIKLARGWCKENPSGIIFQKISGTYMGFWYIPIRKIFGLFICILNSENQGLEESRSISNPRNVLGSAQGLHPEKKSGFTLST